MDFQFFEIQFFEKPLVFFVVFVFVVFVVDRTSLTFSLARQYAANGVTCNGIAPCYVYGPMMEALDAKTQAELKESIPVKNFCTPEEVAQ